MENLERYLETIERLSEVALIVVRKIRNLDTAVTTAKEFCKLQDELNQLQSWASTHKGVVAARVVWFDFGLQSFEKHFVEPIEAKQEGWEKWFGYTENQLPNMLMGMETISHFLSSSYLGGTIMEFYPRVVALVDRLIKASESNPEMKKRWEDQKETLNWMLFNGKIV